MVLLSEHNIMKPSSHATVHKGWKVLASNGELVAQALKRLPELLMVKQNSHGVHEGWKVLASKAEFIVQAFQRLPEHFIVEPSRKAVARNGFKVLARNSELVVNANQRLPDTSLSSRAATILLTKSSLAMPNTSCKRF